MRRRNKLVILATLILLALGVVAGRYVYSQGFAKKWRIYITEEFEKRGVYLEFEKLTMDPVRGLVAREVTLFDNVNRKRKLAKIDHISLDIDYAGIGEDDQFLDSIDLKDASLWLRLDSENGSSELLTIDNFSARIHLTGDRVQISRAEGQVNGVEVSLRGLFFSGGAGGEVEVASEEEGSGDSGGKGEVGISESGSAATREVLSKVVRWLGDLKFDPSSPPQLEIDIHGGDLSKPEDLRGTFHFVGSDLQMGRYVCQEVEVIVETGRGGAVLKRFSVVDNSGRLEADAEYRYGEDSARFHLESEADLPGFLWGALGWHPLGEVVFYEAPKVSMQGKFYLSPEKYSLGFPVSAVGSIKCGTLGSRGKIFESAQTDFSLEGDRFYLRNVVVEHRTGGFSGEAIQDASGFRYRATLTLDPTEFAPFCAQQSTRDLMRKFEFGQESSVFVEMSGSGPDADPANWENVAEIELRNFRFAGMDVRRFVGELNLGSNVQDFSGIEVRLEEGIATADALTLDPVNEVVEIRNLRGTFDSVEVMRCFAIGESEMVPRFYFSELPQMEVDGIFDLAGGSRSDLKVNVKTDAPVAWRFGGTDVGVTEINAEIRLLSHEVDVTGNGRLYGGDLEFDCSLVAGGGWEGRVGIEGVGFGELMGTFEGNAKTGGKLDGEFSFSQAVSNLSKRRPDFSGLNFRGELEVQGGEISVIPGVGGLIEAIGGRPEDADSRWVAAEMGGDVRLDDGKFQVKDFQAESAEFRIQGEGVVDLKEEEAELKAEASVGRGESKSYVGKGRAGELTWERMSEDRSEGNE